MNEKEFQRMRESIGILAHSDVQAALQELEMDWPNLGDTRIVVLDSMSCIAGSDIEQFDPVYIVDRSPIGVPIVATAKLAKATKKATKAAVELNKALATVPTHDEDPHPSQVKPPHPNSRPKLSESERWFKGNCVRGADYHLTKRKS